MIESGYYPPGAEHDPSAPWNETDDYTLLIEVDFYGEVSLIFRTYIEEEDWNDEIENIDPEVFEEFTARKLNLDYETLRLNEEVIDIEDIVEEKRRWKIITSHGEFYATSDQLKELV